MPDRTRLRTTWDGLFISEEPPHGATVIVFRRDRANEPRFLVLHRRATEGDWAWGPPAGARLPGEPVDDCARRELDATTGLRLALRPIPHEVAWAVFSAETVDDQPVRLSAEHDRFEWLDLEEAVRRCQPQIVGEQFELLAAAAAA